MSTHIGESELRLLAYLHERAAGRGERIALNPRPIARSLRIGSDQFARVSSALAAHDLVGCQDIAWDVAGAVVELGLTEVERDRLCAELGGVDAGLLRFMLACYPAFQLGLNSMAADAWGGGEEAARARAAARRRRPRSASMAAVPSG